MVGCRDFSYDASFTSGNPDSTGVPDAGPRACERLTLCSPITGFQYAVRGTDYTCTLERQRDGQCTDGNAAAVYAGQSNTYAVRVTVENLYEDAILAYVQGAGVRAGRDQCRAVAGEADNVMDARGLKGLCEDHGRQDGGKSPCQHRLAHPRETREEDVMSITLAALQVRH